MPYLLASGRGEETLLDIPIQNHIDLALQPVAHRGSVVLDAVRSLRPLHHVPQEILVLDLRDFQFVQMIVYLVLQAYAVGAEVVAVCLLVACVVIPSPLVQVGLPGILELVTQDADKVLAPLVS